MSSGFGTDPVPGEVVPPIAPAPDVPSLPSDLETASLPSDLEKASPPFCPETASRPAGTDVTTVTSTESAVVLPPDSAVLSPESAALPSKIGAKIGAKIGLRVRNGPGAGRILPLIAPKALIGRSDPPAVTVDIDLTDFERGEVPVVSRRHAAIDWSEGHLTITDLGSINGTWVNGKRLVVRDPDRVSAPAGVRPGDRIVLADLELEVIEHDRDIA